jgi:hypothetical protein
MRTSLICGKNPRYGSLTAFSILFKNKDDQFEPAPSAAVGSPNVLYSWTTKINTAWRGGRQMN